MLTNILSFTLNKGYCEKFRAIYKIKQIQIVMGKNRLAGEIKWGFRPTRINRGNNIWNTHNLNYFFNYLDSQLWALTYHFTPNFWTDLPMLSILLTYQFVFNYLFILLESDLSVGVHTITNLYVVLWHNDRFFVVDFRYSVSKLKLLS